MILKGFKTRILSASLIQIFVQIFLPFCFAETKFHSAADKYKEYFANSGNSETTSQKEKASALETLCVAGACTAKAIAAETQALFLIASVASIEGAKQHYEISKIKGQNFWNEELAEVMGKSAGTVLKSSEISGGLLSMLAVNKSLSVPMEVWNSLVKNSVTNGLLRQFLVNASANLVGFAGFEAGAELVKRAIERIPNQKDREKAFFLTPAFLKCLAGIQGPQTAEEGRLIKLVLANMHHILVEDSELRESWWSFVTRNRIQTGNFVTGVAMMSTGGMIGARAGAWLGSCVPHPVSKFAAPVLGATFGFFTGVVSGVAAGFIPKKQKDKITMGFQDKRMEYSTRQIRTSQQEIMENLRKLEMENTEASYSTMKEFRGTKAKIPVLISEVQKNMKNLNSARDEMMTSFFDRVYLLNSRLLANQNKMNLAADLDNVQSISEYGKLKDEHYSQFRSGRKEIEKRLSSEIVFFDQQIGKNIGPEMKDLMTKSREETIKLKNFTSRFMDQIESTAVWGSNAPKVIAPSLMSEQENYQLLERIYLDGYKRSAFVAVMDNFN